MKPIDQLSERIHLANEAGAPLHLVRLVSLPDPMGALMPTSMTVGIAVYRLDLGNARQPILRSCNKQMGSFGSLELAHVAARTLARSEPRHWRHIGRVYPIDDHVATVLLDKFSAAPEGEQ